MQKEWMFKKDSLTIKVYNSREEMGRNVAKEVALKIKELLLDKEEVNIVFGAAPSQNDFLYNLVKMKDVAWERINAFHLDEYVGLPDEAPQKFAKYLFDRIFSRVPFKAVYYLDGNAASIEKEAERYASLLRKHTLDIACVGIGENGHIAFNEPHVADFKDKEIVKTVNLDYKSRNQQVNDACFSNINDVPKSALTMTIPAILISKAIFCIVPGKTKAEAVKQTLNGLISESCPASILRKHPKAILYLDKDSASLLGKRR